MARASGLAVALALCTPACSACGGGGASPGGTTAGATTTASAEPSSSATPGTATITARPRPPVLESVAAKHPGIRLAWTARPPCDMVEGERQDMLSPYPSQATPPGPPLFGVPGATTTYLDTAPTQNMLFTYRVRCKASGVSSDWSNELAANPTK